MDHVSPRFSRSSVSYCLIFFIVYFTALAQDPEPLQVDTAAQDDASQIILEESKPDEDINEEIVDDPYVLAEVTLPSRICQLLLIYHDFPTKWLYRSTMDSQQCCAAASATHVPNASQEISV